MKSVTLINPQKKFGYSGIFLDPWSGYDIDKAVFSNDGSKYKVQFYDGSGRKLRSFYSKPVYDELYWNLIRRSWRSIKYVH